ncbi:MAG: hypothetical protein A2021_04530 [Elusimicrobia bacterium GWF2_52_66]|nr:MAG: hypothetical protein A2X33_08495 [Elusimicrobia bacterium GWA2_51_34]OGR86276.1 MAG: hypothetical protein A2021_04530 [Elusimicrobia bacterium GWF2_52_66]HAF95281.1 hypothetical protein [Elusimicrobiota bacterium]HCE97358.1 hypothetical protein [Elusimicrobiota bacterium]
MKKIKIIQLFAAAALCSGQAGAQNIDFDNLPSIMDITAQASQIAAPAPQAVRVAQEPAPAQTSAPKEWTIMVFMNGKNNLADYILKDMNEMEQVGSSDKINIVTEAGKMAYTAPSNPYNDGWGDFPDINPWNNYYMHPGWPPAPSFNTPSTETAETPSVDSWVGVRRYYVQKDNDTSKLGSLLVEELPKTDMGDWNELVEFTRWAKAKYPAKKYMLIVWNHGDGWITKSLKISLPKGISYDDETGNGITTVQLGQALAKIGGVDIYASDACLMQMAEVVYELKDYAPVIVGSEETEPGDGWDYAAFFSRLTSSLTPTALAKAAVEGYAASYSAKGQAATLSAIRTRNADNLRGLLDQWVTLAMAQDKAKLNEALRESTGFKGADSRDLLHFLSITGVKLPELQAKGAEIASLVSSMMIKNAPVGSTYKNAGGLGIYLPYYSFDDNYSKLAMSKTGKWDSFIKWMTDKEPAAPTAPAAPTR